MCLLPGTICYCTLAHHNLPGPLDECLCELCAAAECLKGLFLGRAGLPSFLHHRARARGQPRPCQSPSPGLHPYCALTMRTPSNQVHPPFRKCCWKSHSAPFLGSDTMKYSAAGEWQGQVAMCRAFACSWSCKHDGMHERALLLCSLTCWGFDGGLVRHPEQYGCRAQAPRKGQAA